MTTPTPQDDFNHFDPAATIDIEVANGEKRLHRVLVAIGLLWLATIPVMMLTFPGASLFHHVWTALLVANITVWPIVLIAGTVVELRKSMVKARARLAERKAERPTVTPAESMLALD